MSEPELELDSDHVYKLRGVEIPGVTSVLTAVGAAPSFWFLSEGELNFYRDRGRAVHKAIELLIRGNLDKRGPKWLKPYITGWERFTNDYNVEVITIAQSSLAHERTNRVGAFTEIPLHHETFRYGVTPDAIAKVKGHIAPIEIKATSSHSPATQIQTAAQDMAVEEVIGQKLSGTRWAVRLLSEEPYYEPKKYTERGDRSTWIGMLSTYNWLKRNNPAALRSNP